MIRVGFSNLDAILKKEFAFKWFPVLEIPVDEFLILR